MTPSASLRTDVLEREDGCRVLVVDDDRDFAEALREMLESRDFIVDTRHGTKQALESEIGFRPEIALIRLNLAELLLQGTPEEKAQAREHLDFAIGEFREMKMKPALERALGHKQVLKA